MYLNSLPFCVVETTSDGRELPKYVMDVSNLTYTNRILLIHKKECGGKLFITGGTTV